LFGGTIEALFSSNLCQGNIMVTAKKSITAKVETVKQPVLVAKVASAAKKDAPKAAPSAPIAAKVPAAAKAPVAKKASPAKPKASATPAAKPALNAEQRNHYVEVAAFYIAERRGFAPGNAADDWCAAEAEVDRLIASGRFSQ
jgi:hypothetical protein